MDALLGEIRNASIYPCCFTGFFFSFAFSGIYLITLEYQR